MCLQVSVEDDLVERPVEHPSKLEYTSFGKRMVPKMGTLSVPETGTKKSVPLLRSTYFMVLISGTESVPIFGTIFFSEYDFRNSIKRFREHIFTPKCSSPCNLLEHLDAV